MIFRISQKLSAKIKAGTLPTLPLHENPFLDWSAHLFLVARSQYILVCNTKSLYSNVMSGKGLTNHDQFIEQALSVIRECLKEQGHESVYERAIIPASGMVRFGKALNRSLTGSMNDLVQQATFFLSKADLSLFEVGFKLNETPMSALPSRSGDSYGTPREVFRRLAEAAKAAPGG
jgi:Domain of unknown function (DUF6933)